MTTLTLPKTSIIIPTFQRPNSLHRLLQVINQQFHTNHQDIEVVVVNDGSHNERYDQLNSVSAYSFPYRYFEMDRLPNNAPNVQAVINFGVDMSIHPLLLILDDGLLIDPHVLFIHRLYHGLLGDDITLWPYECFAEEDGFVSRACEQAHNQTKVASGPLIDVWVTMGGNSLRKEAWYSVNGLDTIFTGNVGADDRDFAIRLYNAGFKIIQADGITRVNSDEETGGSWTAKLSPLSGHINEGVFLERWPEYKGWNWGVE